MEFVTSTYECTRAFPKDEEFGLKSQLRRSAVSVPSNIAEGLTRRSRNDKLHFLNIAQASCSEIDTQTEIAFRLGYFDEDTYSAMEQRLVLIQKLLGGLVRSIRD